MCAQKKFQTFKVFSPCGPVGMCRIVSPSYSKSQTDTFPIQVDEQQELVTVAAGVPQRILLDYLAAYTYAFFLERAARHCPLRDLI